MSSHGTDNGSMHQSCSWTLQQHGMRAGLRMHTWLSVGIHAYGQWISLHCWLRRRETVSLQWALCKVFNDIQHRFSTNFFLFFFSISAKTHEKSETHGLFKLHFFSRKIKNQTFCRYVSRCIFDNLSASGAGDLLNTEWGRMLNSESAPVDHAKDYLACFCELAQELLYPSVQKERKQVYAITSITGRMWAGRS